MGLIIGHVAPNICDGVVMDLDTSAEKRPITLLTLTRHGSHEVALCSTRTTMSVPHFSGSSSSQSVCTWWLRGCCRFGDSCMRLHGQDTNVRCEYLWNYPGSNSKTQKTFHQKGQNARDSDLPLPLVSRWLQLALDLQEILNNISRTEGKNWRSKNRVNGDMGRIRFKCSIKFLYSHATLNIRTWHKR